jgi:hypothetical protein
MPAPAPNTTKDWITNLPDVESGGVQTNTATAAPDPTPPPNKPPTEPPKPSAETPEPKPDVAKPEAPKPSDAPTDGEKWPRTAKDWDAFKSARAEKEKKLTSERDAIRAEKEALAKELEAAKKAGVPDLEALKKERDELDRQLRQVDIERHPRFKEYFEKNRKAAIDRAKSIVGADNAAEIERILQLPKAQRDDELDALIGELSPLRQAQLGNQVERLDALAEEREAEIAQSRENYEKIQQQQEAALAQQQKQIQDLVTSTVTEFRGTDEGRLMDDATADLASKVALGGTKDPKDVVKIVARGIIYPKLLEAWAADKATISTLEARIKALETATPGPGKGAAAQGDGTTPTLAANSSPAEALKHWMTDMTTKMTG